MGPTMAMMVLDNLIKRKIHKPSYEEITEM